MRRHSEHGIGVASQRLAYLESKTAELERKFAEASQRRQGDLRPSGARRSAAAVPLGHARGRSAPGGEKGQAWRADFHAEPDQPFAADFDGAPDHPFAADFDGGPDQPFAGGFDAAPGRPFAAGFDAAPGQPFPADFDPEREQPFLPDFDYYSSEQYPPDDRTEVIVSQGRRSAYHRGYSRRAKVAAGAGIAAVLVMILVLALSGSTASWPASVAVVQHEIARACQNPNVKSEPDQVDFACAKSTQQILWIFALLTSNDNPRFADPGNGRRGLEPITPAQGGELAWSLNLHHPYDPADPIDSLEVAARAIDNIIGGATLTSASGRAVVQPGLEGVAANCLRYTGSPKVNSRGGFPGLCARPVTSPAGQAALVADVFRRWLPGAAPVAARDAAVLFANAKNPGDPQVQAILRRLPDRRLLA